MTEPQNDATEAPRPPESEPVEPARKAGRRKRALVAAGMAVAVLAGGGVWAASALGNADRSAPTAYWVAEGERVPKAGEAGPVPANALTGKLLPVPQDYSPGPDLDGDGNDFFVTGEKAIEGLKEAGGGLSTSERKKRDEALAGLKLKGLAGRGYTGRNGDLVIEVRITQADPQTLGAFSEVSKKFLDITGDGREAPKVDGYPDARCALVAVGEEKKEKIDSLYCVAVEGDVMLDFRAYGRKPFPTSDAVGFLKNQLSHLKSPGESV